MKTATGLAIVAVGAILAFAVTGHPGWLNVQAAGWVLILVGLAGMFVPRRGYGWLRRRVVRRPVTGRTAVPGVVTSSGTALPAGTVVLTPEQAQAVESGALAEDPEVFPGRQISKAEVGEQVAASPLSSTSETIEEYLEE
jgi:branched-subunit amino acid ABC-type transport system permease component